MDLRIFARSCHVGIKIRFWEKSFARPPRTAILSIFLVLSVCEYRPGNGLSSRSREDISVTSAKSIGSRLNSNEVKHRRLRHRCESRWKRRECARDLCQVLQICRPSRGESRRVGPSSSSRVAVVVATAGLVAVAGSVTWVCMGFVSNGTSSPVSGPFPAEAFKASNTRGDPPPHIRDAPHRARAAPA